MLETAVHGNMVPELIMLNRSRSRPLEPSDCEIFATT